jgi:hypothetical protein
MREMTDLIFKFGLVFLTMTGFSSKAHSAIPSSRTILGRLARNNGKGAYIIEQEIVFHAAGEPVTLRERWYVENGDNMRLVVYSPKGGNKSSEDIHFDVIYHGNHRTAPDLKGGVKSSGLPLEFIENFAHIRSTPAFESAFARAGIIPADFGTGKSHWSPNQRNANAPESLVRLGRYGGVVNYVFGEATPTDAKKNSPGVWIEQDSFVLRRLRFPSEAEVTFDRHAAQGAALRLARERTVSWENNSAVIHVTLVKAVAIAQVQRMLDTSSVSSEAAVARLPDQAQVREFYSRFR